MAAQLGCLKLPSQPLMVDPTFFPRMSNALVELMCAYLFVKPNHDGAFAKLTAR